jgi:hypothetical protein
MGDSARLFHSAFLNPIRCLLVPKDDKSGHRQEYLRILSNTEQKGLADNCRMYTLLRSFMAQKLLRIISRNIHNDKIEPDDSANWTQVTGRKRE